MKFRFFPGQRLNEYSPRWNIKNHYKSIIANMIKYYREEKKTIGVCRPHHANSECNPKLYGTNEKKNYCCIQCKYWMDYSYIQSNYRNAWVWILCLCVSFGKQTDRTNRQRERGQILNFFFQINIEIWKWNQLDYTYITNNKCNRKEEFQSIEKKSRQKHIFGRQFIHFSVQFFIGLQLTCSV